MEDSDNRLYVVGGETSATNTLSTPSHNLETALDVACRHTTGDTTNANIVTHVFDSFVGPLPGVLKKDMDGHNVHDGAEMKYWPEGYWTPDYFTAELLIQHNEGKCGAWADLFSKVLSIHSINSSVSTITAYNTLNYPEPDDTTWVHESRGLAVGTSHAGQGNSGTPRQQKNDGENSGLPYNFTNHAVVLIPSVTGDPSKTVYDPSYANTFCQTDLDASKLSWQNTSLTGIWRTWKDANQVRHTKNKELNYTYLWTSW